MKKIIVPTGYMGSGSSAVTDLVAEYKNCNNGFSDFEYVFLHCPNGLFDLEDKLLLGNNALRSDEALRSFEERMNDLYSLKYWWVAKYNKIIGKQFKIYTDEFINSITTNRYKGFWYEHQYPTPSVIAKLVLKKPFKIASRNKLFKRATLCRKDEMKISLINKEEFYSNAKKYIYNITGSLCSKDENIILDQLLLPHNLYRIDNYFNNDLKVIVVERDPRDVFILNKYIWASKNLEIPYPKDVEEFCKYYKRMRESENIKQSNKVLRIHFEDLIYNYEKQVKEIEDFIGLNNKDHINKLSRLNPEISIKNTQLFRKEEYKDEIKVIEKELKNYLYSFPYEINNDVKNSIN